MPENNDMNPESGRKLLTRSNFLKLGLAAIAAPQLRRLLPRDGAQSSQDPPMPDAFEIFKDPDHLLTDEELAQNNITISQGTETQLFLKPGIFNFEIFKDARNGKTGGVEIALIDSPNMDPEATTNLDPDAKAVFGGIYNLFNNDNDRESFASVTGLFVAQDTLTKFYKVLDSLSVEARDKNYIFLAVGGEYAPKPEHSYPDPNILLSEKRSKSERRDRHDYIYNFTPDLGRKIPSFVLRHELSHYGDGRGREDLADQGAADSLWDAWKKSQYGDNSEYCFVFKNRFGTTTAGRKTSDLPTSL